MAGIEHSTHRLNSPHRCTVAPGKACFVTTSTSRRRSRSVAPHLELLLFSLVRQAGYDARLAEPDVLLRVGERDIGLAAKRVRSRNPARFRKNVLKAVSQVSKHGDDGIIVLDVSPLVNPKNGIAVVPSLEAALSHAQAVSRSVVRRFGDVFGRAGRVGAASGLLVFF